MGSTGPDLDFSGLSPEIAQVAEQLFSVRARVENEVSARARTKWPALGGTLQNFSAITRRTFQIPVPDGEPEAVREYRGIKEVDGSVAALERDEDDFPTVNPGNERVVTLVAQQVAGLIDHLYGVGVLMAANSPIRPTLAACRAVLLAGVRLSWIAGPTVDIRTRVGRAVAIELEHQKASLRDLGLDDVEARNSQESEIEALLTTAEADGFQRGKGRTLVGYVHPDDEVARNAADELGRWAWRTLSSSAHVQDRGSYTTFALGQLVPVHDDRIARAYAVGSIFPAVVLAYQGLEHAAQYLGHDTVALEQLLPSFAGQWERGGMHWSVKLPDFD